MASVTLRLEKTVMTDDYRLVATITAASPTGMYPLIVVQEGVDAYHEDYTRVATLSDLARYTENPLVRIDAAVAGEFTGATPGNILTITNASTAAPEWFDPTYFPTADFILATVSADYVTVLATKPFPTATTGLTWTTPGTGGGSNAKTRREDTSETTFLRRHWNESFPTVVEAEGRATSMKSYIQAVVDDANVHGVAFAGVETEVYS